MRVFRNVWICAVRAAFLWAIAGMPALAAAQSSDEPSDQSSNQSPTGRADAVPEPESEIQEPASNFKMAAIGLGAGAVVFGAGALVGVLGSEGSSSSLRGSLGFGLGSVLGAVALPTGVHLANHGRGSWGLTTLTSLGCAVVGTGAIYLATREPYVLVTVPVFQIVGAIIVQKATMDHDGSAAELSAQNGQQQRGAFSTRIDVVPQPDGIGVVLSGRF